jgi:hypothetical protein
LQFEPVGLKIKTIVINSEYEHYKGFLYRVLAIARHSETLEELVVYQALYGEKEIWIRPLAMFLENIEVGGIELPSANLSCNPLEGIIPTFCAHFRELYFLLKTDFKRLFFFR